MNPENDIVKELKELQSPLAHMPRTMPFAVPEGYFSSLDLRAITSEEDPALNLPKAMPFALPEGYFSSVAIADIIEKAEREPLPGLPKTMPFEVPEGYFEQFAAGILDKAEAPAFGKIGPAPFDAPAGYFDGFADRMLTAARAAAPGNNMPARTIDFRPQWSTIRWAAAAMLVIGIGVGSFMRFGGTAIAPERLSAAGQLAMLDKGVIRSYVQQHIDEFDTELLAEHSALLGQSPEKSIRKLQENDIRQYLEDSDLGDSGIN